MTFRVHFYAEQAFLSQAKTLSESDDKEKGAEITALCLVACVMAIEAVCNRLLSSSLSNEEMRKLSIKDKMDMALSVQAEKINMCADPWSSIDRLIKVRNWLVHYKDYDLGLVNGDFKWIDSPDGKKAEFDPFTELTLVKAKKYYRRTLEALQILVSSVEEDASEYEYLQTEKYEPFLVG